MAEADPEAPPAAAPPPRRPARRAAQLVYWAVTAWICAAGAISVTLQVFAASDAPPPGATCAAGLRALVAAVARARRAAATNEGTEDEALARFRAALEPEWAARDAVAKLCREKADDERALDAIERLRYAEEHAVRREAGELAPLRRRVQSLVDEKLAPTATPPEPASP
ncbi:MAG TPA: hypothetical protein VHB21_01240 [Minicystis sp.]|nr:hypothetical protein [Minicystis sp.]